MAQVLSSPGLAVFRVVVPYSERIGENRITTERIGNTDAPW
jgi:hypothetical protein